jgi:hypothetical protein
MLRRRAYPGSVETIQARVRAARAWRGRASIEVASPLQGKPVLGPPLVCFSSVPLSIAPLYTFAHSERIGIELGKCPIPGTFFDIRILHVCSICRRSRPSAGVLALFRRAWMLPSLWTLMLHRSLVTIDEQAIALSLALAAYSSVPQSRATTRIARCRQFFIHFGESLCQGDLRQVTPSSPPLFLHEIGCQMVRD